MKRHLNVMLLVDPETVSAGSTARRPLWSEPGLRECDIFQALRAANCVPRVCTSTTLGRNVSIQRGHIDLIFNMTVHCEGDRRHAARIAAFLDTLQIPYTGSGPQAILRASDKYVSKHLASLCGVRVPDFCCIAPGELTGRGEMKLPVIVKPRFGGGSEGIVDRSLVRTRAEMETAVKRIHRTFKHAAVCEEFIEGREITVGVLGNRSPVVSLPRERVFPKAGAGGPAFATYRVKRDPRYRDKWGILWRNAALSRATRESLQNWSLVLYRSLGLADYARFDFRLPRSGLPVFLEANHSPECGRKSQFFAMFHQALNLDYEGTILTIAGLALRRHCAVPLGLRAWFQRFDDLA
jgi:D-alanine-D-alanine ligase